MLVDMNSKEENSQDFYPVPSNVFSVHSVYIVQCLHYKRVSNHFFSTGWRGIELLRPNSWT